MQRILALKEKSSTMQNLWIGISHFANQHTSLARPSPHLQLARRPVFASPVAPSLARPSPRLWLARRPVFASPVAPSSPRPSPRLRLARRPVFASPVAPSSPRPSLRLVVAPSSPRPSPRLRFARRPVFASPVAPSSPRPSPRLRLVIASSLLVSFLLGSGSAVLPNGLYAMGGTVAQAVWLKVDRRGNAPLGTPPCRCGDGCLGCAFP
ncbi:hypothetical protein OUZ56_015432 [Daphnia magna]|uniref:Uncharacterized protein n=1 Tax=Daphnia magna TaxID=35525 RepID=A0ABR0AMU3_9CRUS|nr:hypothetical protein OUZ56_015432 [Daphnia magna]